MVGTGWSLTILLGQLVYRIPRLIGVDVEHIAQQRDTGRLWDLTGHGVEREDYFARLEERKTTRSEAREGGEQASLKPLAAFSTDLQLAS